jgi:hypothetical protein
MPRTQSLTSPRPRRRTSLLFALTAALLLLTSGVATAAATPTITQVWSFSGGEIAIQPEGTTGKYEGVVVKETAFATCTHPVGERIWTEIEPQTDGSFWGKHQWYKTTGTAASCTPNPTRGDTAFRVVEDSSGAYLRVCLSEPGKPQPTIPPGSAGSGSYPGGEHGCVSSSLVSPLPTTNGGGSTPGSTPNGKSGTQAYIERLILPGNAKCLSSRQFVIHLKDPENDPFKTVKITIKGHKIKTKRVGKYINATISLKGLPHGKFTIKISAVTVLGHHLSGTRTYHTCAKKAKKSKPKKLS